MEKLANDDIYMHAVEQVRKYRKQITDVNANETPALFKALTYLINDNVNVIKRKQGQLCR